MVSRKKKLFCGVKPIGGQKLKSRKKARIVTSEYHNIRNEQLIVERSSEYGGEEKQKKLNELSNRLQAIGGTEMYQQASVVSTNHFKTSRWVISTIEALGVKASKNKDKDRHTDADTDTDSKSLTRKDNESKANKNKAKSKPKRKVKVLEVGAINTQLQECKWMTVRAIDVNSQNPRIEERDFFDLCPVKEQYEVVVCSMVVNCVTDPEKRGEMLCRLCAHVELARGYVLLVLPLRCINSKSVGGEQVFMEFLSGIGLKEALPRRITPKLVFFVLQRIHSSTDNNDDDGDDGGDGGGNDDNDNDHNDGDGDGDENEDEDGDGDEDEEDELDDENKDGCRGSSSSTSRISANSPWKQRIWERVHSSMRAGTFRKFTRDCSAVPPTEFCFSIADFMLTS